TGRTLQLLTATKKPWIHARNLVEIVTLESELYYDFVNIPPKFNELLKKLGVDYAGDLRNRDAALLGSNKSPLTNQKNRLVSRHEDATGKGFWVSYDIAPGGDNLFENPLLRETGSQRVFRFDATEVIWFNPNGLMGFALYDK